MKGPYRMHFFSKTLTIHIKESKVINLVFGFLLVCFLFEGKISFAHAPHDTVKAIDLSPKYDQDQTVLSIIRYNNLFKSNDGGQSWKRIVKGLDNKYLLSDIAFSPNKATTIFLSSNGDGVYKSEDGGASWSKANNMLESLRISTLAACSDKLVFAIGENGELHKTENGGKSWNYTEFNKINLVDCINDGQVNRITISSSNKINYSLDSGKSWTQNIQLPNGDTITAIQLSPNFKADETFYVGTEENGIWKTVNGGRLFTKINNGISDKNITSIALSPNYMEDFTIFISTWNDGVFRSTNRGETWEKYAQGLSSDLQADQLMDSHYRNLSISKTFAKDKTIFLGGFGGVFKSTNSGRIWKEMETLPLTIIVGMGISPGYADDSTIAISTYLAGAYLSQDRGMTWQGINNGLSRPGFLTKIRKVLSGENLLKYRIMDIIFSPNYPQDETLISSSSGHFKYLLMSDKKDKVWRKIHLSSNKDKSQIWPDIIVLSPLFSNDGTIYLGGRRKGGIFIFNKQGTRFSPIDKDTSQWINSIVVSPNFASDQTIFVSMNRRNDSNCESVLSGADSVAQSKCPHTGVYKTEDGGETWQRMNGLKFTYKAIELAISPNYKSDKIVLAGTISGLFKTTNGGKSWVKLSGTAYGGNGYIEGISISPNYQADQTFIVSVKGRGLFKTVNGGENFTQIATNLINNNYSLARMYDFIPSASSPIQFSPSYATDNTIYGNSATELFKSTDGGNSWEKVSIRYENETTRFIIRLVGYTLFTIVLTLMVYFFSKKFLRRIIFTKL